MQIHKDSLERFQQAVGGVGIVFGPYKNGKSPSPLYHFKVRGFEGVQSVIAMLWPWLGVHKRDQALIALARFRLTWAPRTHRSPEEIRRYQRDWARNRWKLVRSGN